MSSALPNHKSWQLSSHSQPLTLLFQCCKNATIHRHFNAKKTVKVEEGRKLFIDHLKGAVFKQKMFAFVGFPSHWSGDRPTNKNKKPRTEKLQTGLILPLHKSTLDSYQLMPLSNKTPELSWLKRSTWWTGQHCIEEGWILSQLQSQVQISVLE